MSITVNCRDCGHRFRVKDESAGRRVSCPECSADVRVRSGGGERPRSSRDEEEEGASLFSKPVVVGLATAGAIVVVGLLAMMMIGGGAAAPVVPPAIVQPTPSGTNGPAGAMANGAAPSGVKPIPPLNLPAPVTPSAMLEGEDLKEADADELRAYANELSAGRRYNEAAQVQYWALQKEPAEGQYNMACYLSLAKNVDAAFYWLQRAALEEGVDGQWATEDSDLVPARADSRWPTVLQFLRQANAFWQTSTHTETTLVMPNGVAATEPIPVLVGLHGMGHRAGGFVSTEMYQEFADKHRVAFVGASGSVPRGPRSFVWAEDAEKDRRRIEAALSEVSDRVTAAPGKIILFGFSQGAMMSAEIAVLDASRYAGAIVLSPGGNNNPNAALFKPGSGQKQTYILSVGQGEHLGNKLMTATYMGLLQKAGADVEHIVNPNQQGHSLPPNYFADLDRWVTKILKGR